MTQPTIVPVLVYHRCPDKFDEHLAYIKDRGFDPVHLTDITEYFETQSPSKFPHNKIVITFDDAYHDFKEKVLPQLVIVSDNTFLCKATICVPVGCIPNGDKECLDLDPAELMNWEELGKLAKHPLLQFIPHSVSHVRFNQLDGLQDKKALLEHEIGKSKEVLINRLNLQQPPLFFCLPGGAGWKTGKESDPQERLVVDVLRQFDYKGALRADYKTGEAWNQFCIPRCEPTSVQRLKELLESEFCCKD